MHYMLLGVLIFVKFTRQRLSATGSELYNSVMNTSYIILNSLYTLRWRQAILYNTSYSYHNLHHSLWFSRISFIYIGSIISTMILKALIVIIITLPEVGHFHSQRRRYSHSKSSICGFGISVYALSMCTSALVTSRWRVVDMGDFENWTLTLNNFCFGVARGVGPLGLVTWDAMASPG